MTDETLSAAEPSDSFETPSTAEPDFKTPTHERVSEPASDAFAEDTPLLTQEQQTEPQPPSAAHPNTEQKSSGAHTAENEPLTDPAQTKERQDTDALVTQKVGANHGTVIGIQIRREIQRLQGDRLSLEWIDERLRTYVSPVKDDLEAIIDSLARHRIVVLHGGPGTGRYTTALAVLRKQAGNNIRQVRREPGETFAVENLMDTGVGWILDLRAEDEKLPSDFGLRLTHDRDLLRNKNSYLVVLTRTDAWQTAGNHADYLSHRLSSPPADQVLRAHLENGRPQVAADRWLGQAAITQGIAGRTPAEVVSWAEAIRTAEDLAAPRSGPISETDESEYLAELTNHVVQAVNDWRKELLKWHKKHPESEHRNYLLTAAVLDGAPVETVYNAAEDLARTLGEELKPRPGQQGLGVIALTDEIGAELGSDDVLCFRRPGYPEAVVDYFWVDRPHLVDRFTQWTAEQAPKLSRELTGSLADRVSQWVLRYTARKGTVRLLHAIVKQWAHPKVLPQYACDLLVAAALDPGAGRRVRDAYLNWARQGDTESPPYLKVVLAQACEQLSTVYPAVMLLRLAELATTNDSKVIEAVGHALDVMWDQPKQRDRIRNALTSWSEGSNEARRNAARLAFAHLAARITPDGLPLLVSPQSDTDPAWVVDRWRSLLETRDHHPTTQRAFDIWMDTALAHSEMRARLLNTFMEAVYRPEVDTTYVIPRFLSLNHLVCAWAPTNFKETSPERAWLRDRLLGTVREADPDLRPPKDHASI